MTVLFFFFCHYCSIWAGLSRAVPLLILLVSLAFVTPAGWQVCRDVGMAGPLSLHVVPRSLHVIAPSGLTSKVAGCLTWQLQAS